MYVSYFSSGNTLNLVTVKLCFFNRIRLKVKVNLRHLQQKIPSAVTKVRRLICFTSDSSDTNHGSLVINFLSIIDLVSRVDY